MLDVVRARFAQPANAAFFRVPTLGNVVTDVVFAPGVLDSPSFQIGVSGSRIGGKVRAMGLGIGNARRCASASSALSRRAWLCSGCSVLPALASGGSGRNARLDGTDASPPGAAVPNSASRSKFGFASGLFHFDNLSSGPSQKCVLSRTPPFVKTRKYLDNTSPSFVDAVPTKRESTGYCCRSNRFGKWRESDG